MVENVNSGALGSFRSESEISVKDFINSKYRQYWEYSNKNGKNAVDAREQLPEVVRKIIYASYLLNIKENSEVKVTTLTGEVIKIHAHGDATISESIKALGASYKVQPAMQLLEGIGNFGAVPGDTGAAARYISVGGTPLLSAIYRDIPFMPMSADDTGEEQPEYISTPLPFSLIGGMSNIGTGRSCYIAERNARDVIKWIDGMRKNEWKDDPLIDAEPDPISVTGCKAWLNNENGYVYYEAIVHEKVDMYDLSKRGKWDVITALPPKETTDSVMMKLIKKLPSRIKDRIIDGSGDGRNLYIIVPTGYLDEKDYTKYGLKTARKEQIYIWDHSLNTMKNATLKAIAKEWFEDRCNVVKNRLKSQIDGLNAVNHRIDLIKTFADKGMIKWKEDEVIDFFTKLNPETGHDDASLVLSQSARAFLPGNLGKNQILRDKNIEKINGLNDTISHIGDEVIEEAFAIIDAQEKFLGKR